MRYPYKEAIGVAEEIVGELKSQCEKIEIAGSLRRKRADVGDVEILCVPGGNELFEPTIERLISDGILDYRYNKKGSRVYGPKNKLLVHCASGIPVDIFSTTEENWWVALVVRTGPKESNIGICMEAKKRGLKFNVYGSGFTRTDGSKGKSICYSEEAVFNIVDLPCLPPEER